MILSCFRTMISLFVVVVTLLAVEGKILRVGKHFTGNFLIVDSNSRVTSNCVSNFTNNCPLKKCVSECIAEKQCMTFNYHKKENICELLNVSKFDAVGILQREVYWVHYETDDDASKVNKLFFNIYIVAQREMGIAYHPRAAPCVQPPASHLPLPTSHLQPPASRLQTPAARLAPRTAPLPSFTFFPFVFFCHLLFVFYVE